MAKKGLALMQQTGAIPLNLLTGEGDMTEPNFFDQVGISWRPGKG